MKGQIIAISLAAIVIEVGPPTWASPEDFVIQVEVLVERRNVEVLSLREAPFWTRDLLPREPQLTTKTWKRLDHDQSELLAVFYNEQGKVLKTYAFPGRPVTFVETLNLNEPGYGTWSGGLGIPTPDVRMLFLPVPERALYILFFRTEVTHESQSADLESRNQERFQVFTSEEIRPDRSEASGNQVVTFGWSYVGICPIPKPPPRPPTPSWPPQIPPILKKPKNTPFPETIPDWVWEEVEGILCSPGPGTVTGHSQLHLAMPMVGSRPYNIVIFGDGFSSSDQSKYQTLATLAANSILGETPFLDHERRINIWQIDTECPASGIPNCTAVAGTNCPDPRLPPDTYYKITGCMPVTQGIPGCNPTHAGYLGPTTLCPFDIAVEQELPGTFVDLRLVIANCRARGGVAYPAERLVVVATCEEMGANQAVTFRELVLHESAHSIAGLCDEYWSCVKWQGETFPNFATLAQVNDNSVPWKALDPLWTQAKHIRGGSPCTTDGKDHNWNWCTGGPTNTPGISETLHGAFWGCQFIDSASVDSTHCCVWGCPNQQADPLGWPYFRPSPRCRMKELGQEYCFACSNAIAFSLENPLPILMP